MRCSTSLLPTSFLKNYGHGGLRDTEPDRREMIHRIEVPVHGMMAVINKNRGLNSRERDGDGYLERRRNHATRSHRAPFASRGWIPTVVMTTSRVYLCSNRLSLYSGFNSMVWSLGSPESGGADGGRHTTRSSTTPEIGTSRGWARILGSSGSIWPFENLTSRNSSVKKRLMHNLHPMSRSTRSKSRTVDQWRWTDVRRSHVSINLS